MSAMCYCWVNARESSSSQRFVGSFQPVESFSISFKKFLSCAHPLVSGWQKHAIEFVLKKALFPHNLLAVRKIAIRLFLLWYQSLAIYNNTNSQLDSVFQCLLPHFPLR